MGRDLADAIAQVADRQRGQKMGMTGEDAELALGPRRDNLVHLLAEQQMVRRDDLQ